MNASLQPHMLSYILISGFVFFAYLTHHICKPNVRYGLNFSIELLVLLGALFLVGFRSLDAGFDTPYYVNTYRSLQDIASARDVGASLFGNDELLFWPTQAVFKALGLSERSWLVALLLIEFILIIVAYSRIARQIGAPSSIGVFVFFTYEIVYFGNVMRQALAVCLVFLAVTLFAERRHFSATVLFLLACGMHWSALAFGLTPAISRYTRLKTLKKPIMLLLFGVAASGFILTIIFNMLGTDTGFSSQLEFYRENNSHFGKVTSTANFWLCLGFGVLAALIHLQAQNDFLNRILAAFWIPFTIAIGARDVGDLSERFFPYVLVFSPLIVYLTFQTLGRRINLPSKAGLPVLACFFIALGAAVLLQQSTRDTLGF